MRLHSIPPQRDVEDFANSDGTGRLQSTHVVFPRFVLHVIFKNISRAHFFFWRAGAALLKLRAIVAGDLFAEPEMSGADENISSTPPTVLLDLVIRAANDVIEQLRTRPSEKIFRIDDEGKDGFSPRWHIRQHSEPVKADEFFADELEASTGEGVRAARQRNVWCTYTRENADRVSAVLLTAVVSKLLSAGRRVIHNNYRIDGQRTIVDHCAVYRMSIIKCKVPMPIDVCPTIVRHTSSGPDVTEEHRYGNWTPSEHVEGHCEQQHTWPVFFVSNGDNSIDYDFHVDLAPHRVGMCMYDMKDMKFAHPRLTEARCLPSPQKDPESDGKVIQKFLSVGDYEMLDGSTVASYVEHTAENWPEEYRLGIEDLMEITISRLNAYSKDVKIHVENETQEMDTKDGN